MAITFYQKRKVQRYLILAFILVLLITVVVLWLGFRKKEAVPPEEEPFRPEKEIKINFELLEEPLLKELEKFGDAEPFEGKVGREQPFLPY